MSIINVLCSIADGRSSDFLNGIVVYVGSGAAALAFVIIVVVVLSVIVVTATCMVRKKRIKVNDYGMYIYNNNFSTWFAAHLEHLTMCKEEKEQTTTPISLGVVKLL